jgi:hypothetical protein
MPAELYTSENGAHCIGSLEKGLYGYAGLTPAAHTLIGSIHTIDEAARKAWLLKIQSDGAVGQ